MTVREKLAEDGILLDERPCDDCVNIEYCRANDVTCSDFNLYVRWSICMRPGDQARVKHHDGTYVTVESDRNPSKRIFSKTYRSRERESNPSKKRNKVKQKPKQTIKRRAKGSVLSQWGFPYNDKQ